MEYVTLGRTGLQVSVAGLGCGGFSRLGLGTGKRRGRGDRADPSGTRPRGQFVRHRRRLRHRSGARQGARVVPREEVVIATKAPFNVSNPNSARRERASPASTARCASSPPTILTSISCTVCPGAYDHARDVIAPALLKSGPRASSDTSASPRPPDDPEHKMLQRAVADGVWDVAMVGFHMMHQNARPRSSR